MLGILAALAFALAFIFHGAGFHASAWLSAPSAAYLGLVLLTLHVLVGLGVPLALHPSRERVARTP